MVWVKTLLIGLKDKIYRTAQQRKARTAYFLDRLFLGLFVSFPALILYWIVSVVFNTFHVYYRFFHKGLYRFWLNHSVRTLVAAKEKGDKNKSQEETVKEPV